MPPAQMERLARAATERLFVNDVTPVTEKTGLGHVYSEKGRQHVVADKDGICSCEDYQYNLDPGERCKHGFRAELALGRRPLLVRRTRLVDRRRSVDPDEIPDVLVTSDAPPR